MNVGADRVEVFISGLSVTHQRYAEFVVDTLSRLDPPVVVQVTDVMENPMRAEEKGIVATPQMVRWLPTPVRRVIGEIEREEDILRLLELRLPTRSVVREH